MSHEAVEDGGHVVETDQLARLQMLQAKERGLMTHHYSAELSLCMIMGCNGWLGSSGHCIFCEPSVFYVARCIIILAVFRVATYVPIREIMLMQKINL